MNELIIYIMTYVLNHLTIGYLFKSCISLFVTLFVLYLFQLLFTKTKFKVFIGM